jgi:hypothetical protein
MLKQLLRRIDGLKKRLEEKADPVHKTPEELDYQDQETQADAMEEGNDIWVLQLELRPPNLTLNRHMKLTCQYHLRHKIVRVLDTRRLCRHLIA